MTELPSVFETDMRGRSIAALSSSPSHYGRGRSKTQAAIQDVSREDCSIARLPRKEQKIVSAQKEKSYIMSTLHPIFGGDTGHRWGPLVVCMFFNHRHVSLAGLLAPCIETFDTIFH